MKLTPQQIEQLFVFTRQHFVEYYDLQLELVDHLANAIEQKWQENPKLTFEEALNLEFKKFGVFGFSDVIEKKHAAMTKIYNSFIWQNVKEFFTFSSTVVTFLMILLLFKLFSLQNLQDYTLIGATFIFIGIMIYHYYTTKKNKKTIKLNKNKKWLLEEIIMHYGNSGWSLLIIPQLLMRMENVQNFYFRIAFCFILVALGILYYVLMITIPKKANEYLTSTYPEYKLEDL